MCCFGPFNAKVYPIVVSVCTKVYVTKHIKFLFDMVILVDYVRVSAPRGLHIKLFKAHDSVLLSFAGWSDVLG